MLFIGEEEGKEYYLMEKSNCKKGNIIDVGFIIIIVFGVVIALFFFFQIWDSITTDLIATKELPNLTTSQLSQHQDIIPNTYDTIIPLLYFGSFFAIMVSAAFIQTNMIFFVIGILVIGIFTFVAAVLSNAYSDIVTGTAALSVYVTDTFRLSDHILNNYPVYASILGVVVLIVLYAKVQRSQI